MTMTQSIPATHTAQVTVRREIAAPAAELFDAWLDVESLSAIMRPNCKTHATVLTDPRVGGTFDILMHGEEQDYPHRGTYLTIDRPHVLEFTWNSHATWDHPSKVRVEFHVLSTDAKRPRTEVVINHQQLPEETAESHVGGWTDILRLLDEHFTNAR